ncbi:diguanylate cyclase [Planomicrobium chinense]|uniref:histidine kinase N-terminal 7TM domain-containing diguanylate cyclase n=1 Tax=Planococcus chinensis TaxID=272917 RepID=UPI001CC75279|nr:histidine kinase N-terminal 7TM domain-containing protein [Planococcus chinensis]MBZ5199639.1 diguanylate cyclase [Planococcus chinensis]
MTSQLTTYVTLICTSGVLNLYLFLYVFLKRHHYSKIAVLFMLYTASISIYCFAAAMGLLAANLGQMKFWTTVQYIGMPVSSPLGLLFIMYYLGIQVTCKRAAALLLIPLISFIMVATNDWHHLHYRSFEIDAALGIPFIYQEIGPWYAVHGIFTFACMFAAFSLLVFRWRETAKTYRLQLVALAFGQLIPMSSSFLYLVGVAPPGIDPVPMVLWISSVLYLWAINSSRLFTIMPIAKDVIFNSINDGVMVLDESNRLIEFNQACRHNWPKLNKTMYGTDFELLWVELTGSPFPLKLETDAKTQELKLPQSEQVFQVRNSPLEQSGNKKGQLLIFTDITELKKLQEKLEQQAYTDELTQIYNRRAFLQQCELEFKAAKENSMPFSVILMDIDHFKRVNDTYGHAIGDQLLMHVVRVCQAQLTEGQIFARYGGEEFVLALKAYSRKEAEALAHRLRKGIESQPFFMGKEAISVTLSLGVAEMPNEPEGKLFQLLNQADQALYMAKEEGRNRVMVYTAKQQLQS